MTTDPRSRAPRGARLRALALFGFATLLAVAGTAAICAFVLRADFLTGAAAAVTRVAFAHGLVAAAAAGSPIVAFLLVGYAYMQRGLRMRAAARRAAAAGAVR
jgi:hypothetical protein